MDTWKMVIAIYIGSTQRVFLSTHSSSGKYCLEPGNRMRAKHLSCGNILPIIVRIDGPRLRAVRDPKQVVHVRNEENIALRV